MPLIFSTYKIKLGGIIPTANLFSRFLEKNVEQAVDVFGFHKNPYAYLLFHSWEHKLLNQVEEASNSQFSQAFPFWSDKGIAQHLNSQESASGDFSAYKQPILFLPLWHDGSWSHTFDSGVSTFKSQATYDQAYKFFTQFGEQPYELIFDKSEVYGTEGRYGQAHPFFTEFGYGMTPVYDESRTGESWLSANRIEPAFFYSSEHGLTPVYDESRAGESFLSSNRIEPSFYYYQLIASNLNFKHEEESSFGSYGTYDPFTPDSYEAGKLSKFLENGYRVERISLSGANEFYLMLEEGLDYKFKNIVESSGDFKWYGYNNFWFDGYEAAQSRSFDFEEAQLDKFNAIYFWYVSKFTAEQKEILNLVESSGSFKEYIYNSFYYDVFVAAKTNEYGTAIPEAVISYVGNYPMFHYQIIESAPLPQFKELFLAESEWKFGRQFISFFHEVNSGVDDYNNDFRTNAVEVLQSNSVPAAEPIIIYKFEGWMHNIEVDGESFNDRFSKAQSFYEYLIPSSSLLHQPTGTGYFSQLRKAQAFWYYTNGSYGVKHYNQEDSAEGREAYYDVYYSGIYTGFNVPDTYNLPAQYKSFPVNTPWFYTTNIGINFPDGHGWITRNSDSAASTPYIANNLPGYGFKAVAYIMSPCEDSINAVPLGINAAYWLKNSDNRQGDLVISSSGHNELALAPAINYAYRLSEGKTFQLFALENLAVASGDFPADPQPYYSREFTGNIDSDLFPHRSESSSAWHFAHADIVTNSYEGLRAQRTYEQTHEYIYELGTGLEIIYDLDILPRTLSDSSFVVTPEAPELTNALKYEPQIGLQEIRTFTDAKNFPEVYMTFNASTGVKEERDFWYIIPLTYLGSALKRVVGPKLFSPAQSYKLGYFEVGPVIAVNDSQNLANVRLEVGQGYSLITLSPRLINYYTGLTATEDEIVPVESANYLNARPTEETFISTGLAEQRVSSMTTLNFY